MKRRLLGLLVGLLGYSVLAIFPAKAGEAWTVEQINKVIEQTNFIVNRGCSGTLISLEKGLILTNYHCIDANVTSIDREVTNPDGSVVRKRIRKFEEVPVSQKTYNGFVLTGESRYVADIVAAEQTRDLAVLKLKGKTNHTVASPIIPDGEAVIRGERVYIVGNPLGNESSLVEGVVSNANRAFDFPWTDGARLPMLQISGGMAGGNSGGSLYNARGYLIGVPAAGYPGATHIGFAIPAHEVIKPFLRENCLAELFDKEFNDVKCRAEQAAKNEKRNNE